MPDGPTMPNDPSIAAIAVNREYTTEGLPGAADNSAIQGEVTSTGNQALQKASSNSGYAAFLNPDEQAKKEARNPTLKKIVKIAAIVLGTLALAGAAAAIALSTFGFGLIPAAFGIAGMGVLGAAGVTAAAVGITKLVKNHHAKKFSEEAVNKRISEQGLTPYSDKAVPPRDVNVNLMFDEKELLENNSPRSDELPAEERASYDIASAKQRQREEAEAAVSSLDETFEEANRKNISARQVILRRLNSAAKKPVSAKPEIKVDPILTRLNSAAKRSSVSTKQRDQAITQEAEAFDKVSLRERLEGCDPQELFTDSFDGGDKPAERPSRRRPLPRINLRR